VTGRLILHTISGIYIHSSGMTSVSSQLDGLTVFGAALTVHSNTTHDARHKTRYNLPSNRVRVRTR
jgi:hypothetical protein